MIWVDTSQAKNVKVNSVFAVKIDFSGQSITIVSLPKDLLVSGKSLAALNIKETRIGQVYEYVASNAVGPLDQVKISAVTLTSQVIQENFQFRSSNYLIFDTPLLLKLIEDIGGIEIILPADYQDLKKGGQILNSSQVEKYIKDASPSEHARQERILWVLDALRYQLLSSSSQPVLTRLIQQVKPQVFTNPDIIDLKPECLAAYADLDRVKFETVDSSLYAVQPDGSLKPSLNEITRFLLANLGFTP
jgi:anionic cell wall polymer biosynthesis LytR-Cps2A-Psr (LCP) family protein